MIKKIILIIVSLVLGVYLIMFFDTNSVMSEIKDSFYGKAQLSSNDILKTYNVTENLENKKDVKVNLTMYRVFVLHNFKRGYIWFRYSVEVVDKKGNVVRGSWHIPVKLTIEKANGKWKVVYIDEAP